MPILFWICLVLLASNPGAADAVGSAVGFLGGAALVIALLVAGGWAWFKTAEIIAKFAIAVVHGFYTSLARNPPALNLENWTGNILTWTLVPAFFIAGLWVLLRINHHI